MKDKLIIILILCVTLLSTIFVTLLIISDSGETQPIVLEKSDDTTTEEHTTEVTVDNEPHYSFDVPDVIANSTAWIEYSNSEYYTEFNFVDYDGWIRGMSPIGENMAYVEYSSDGVFIWVEDSSNNVIVTFE